jgi:hypothetical protein
MKNPQKPNDLPPLPDRTLDLSEEIAAEEEEDELETLDKDDLGARDPELTTPGLANVTSWDEPAGVAGRRLDTVGFEDENDFPRQLAESGVDVADSEQREIRERDEQVEEAEEAEAEEAEEVAAESGKTR